MTGVYLHEIAMVVVAYSISYVKITFAAVEILQAIWHAEFNAC